MLRAVLIDDELSNLESLSIELGAYCPDVKICAVCDSPEAGLEAIQAHQPDMVFLDIEMPKINGFDLLRRLPAINFEIIFATAYDKFAIKAFEFNAVDYLLKPVLKDKLIQAVEKVKSKRLKTVSSQQLEMLINHIQQFQKPLPNIALPCSDGLEFIPVAEIQYAEADGSYTYIYLSSGRKLMLSRQLKDLEQLLAQHSFLRVHQSYLVNIAHARKYIKGQGGQLLLQNGVSIPVSRAKRKEVVKLGQF